jgi:hypothetical protein
MTVESFSEVGEEVETRPARPLHRRREMKTQAQYLAEAEERAKGKSFEQLMYEFYTGGFRPQRPAAKVLEFPDPLGQKSARLEAWEKAKEMARDMARQRQATGG